MNLTMNIRDLSCVYGLQRAAELVAEAGFDSVDCFIALDEASSPLNGDDYRSVAQQMSREIRRAGISCRQTHAPFRFPARRWDEENGMRDTIIRSLEISAILGARLCVVHPLHHMEYRGHEEEIFALNMDYYRSLIPYCREFNIKVGVENMWQKHRIRGNISHDTCSRVEEFVRYIDTLDSEYLPACLDLGHTVLPDNTAEPEEFVRRLGHDRLAALHVHDNDYKSDQHLLPYHGKLNWSAITAALGEIDYSGDLTYEIGAAEIGVPEPLVGAALGYAASVGRHLIERIEASRRG